MEKKVFGEPVLVMLVDDNVDHANKIKHFLDGQTALDYLLRCGEYADPATQPSPAYDSA